MGKILELKINDFSGGMSEDKRVQSANKYSLVKGFNSRAYPHKLIPQFDTTASVGENKPAKIVKFFDYVSSGNTFLYGLGISSASSYGTDYAGVWRYNVTADTGWEATARAEASVYTVHNKNVFFYYKDALYLFAASNSVSNCVMSRFVLSTDALTEDYQLNGTTSFSTYTYPFNTTTFAQPVLHPSDDIAYFFSNYSVHSLNGTVWTANVLQLPTNFVITSACAHGNYLAIGGYETTSYLGKSIVYLWDRDSSLTTLTERIDFGTGFLRHLVSLDGVLTAVIEYDTGPSPYGLHKRGRVFIKQPNGIFGEVANEITTDSTVSDTNLTVRGFVQNNKFYFPMRMNLDGDARFGIWGVDAQGRLNIEAIEAEHARLREPVQSQWQLMRQDRRGCRLGGRLGGNQGPGLGQGVHLVPLLSVDGRWMAGRACRDND